MRVLVLVVLVCLAVAGAAASETVPPDSGVSARFDWFDYQGKDPVNAAFNAGPDDYRNPILAGFYPDPSITRVGDDYYLVNSSFCYFPGIPVFHSRDLVHWIQIGNAIDRPEQLNFKGLGLSRGVFAPAITHHGELFYILNTCVDCGGNYLLTAKDPAGPWSDPIWLKEIDGIDPSLFFDEDGQAYLLNNGPPPGRPLYDGHRAIWIQAFDLQAMRPTGPRTLLVNGGANPSAKPIWAEGPHIIKRGGWYYLITAEGGTAEQHSEVAYRSRDVLGPYAPDPGNPILTQRDLDPARPFPVTSAGHAEFVTTPGGAWWSIFLATRPYQANHYNTGRETFILPVRWQDDWPTILPGGAAVPYVHSRPALPRQPPAPIPTSGDFEVREDFDGPKVAPYWMTIRAPQRDGFDLSSTPGSLTLHAGADKIGALGEPAFVGRRQQHGWMSASTAMRYVPSRPGDKSGLLALQSDDFYYFLGETLQDGRPVVRLERRAGSKDPADGVVIASAPIAPRPGAPLYLKIRARGGLYDFSYALRPGRWIALKTNADGEILSTKTAGGFVGSVIGMYAVRGKAAAP